MSDGVDGDVITANIAFIEVYVGCPTGQVAIGAFTTSLAEGNYTVQVSEPAPPTAVRPRRWHMLYDNNTDVFPADAYGFYAICVKLPE